MLHFTLPSSITDEIIIDDGSLIYSRAEGSRLSFWVMSLIL